MYLILHYCVSGGGVYSPNFRRFLKALLLSLWLIGSAAAFSNLKAQSYKNDFSSSPTLYEGSWTGSKTHATFFLGGVEYLVTIGQVTNWEHYGSGGESNSANISAIGGGDVNVVLQRKDGQRFQFYGAWLKYNNYDVYTNKDLRVSYSGSADAQQTFPGNNTVSITKNVNVKSVSFWFGGLDRLNLDNIIVGPAQASLATVSTSAASVINSTSATLGGSVTNDGGGTITERGVVWSSTNTTPTTSDTKQAIGSGTGFFTGQVTGLSTTTNYYARAYAINSGGTAYGAVVSFTTLDANAPSTLNPILDTWVDGIYSGPTDNVLYTGYNTEYGDQKAVFKFDLSALSGTVSTATFRIYIASIYNGTAPVKVWSSSTDSWTSATVSAPTVNSPELGAVTASTPGWLEFDVKTFVAGELAGDKIVTLVVGGNSSGTVDEDFEINAVENVSNKPELLIAMGTADNKPTTVGSISALSVLENAANTTLNLESYFTDTEDGADGLTYSVESTDPAYFSTSIDANNVLTIDYAATGTGGPATVKVRATDSGDQFVEQSFTVTVSAGNVSFAISGTESFNEGNTGSQGKTFTITKAGTTNLSSQLTFTFSGTAAYTADYTNIGGTTGATGTSGTITFGPAEISKTITLDVPGNTLYEEDKSIVVTLSDATAFGSGAATITTAMATKTISNDDALPLVSIGTDKSELSENGGTISLTATLNTVSAKDVTVNIAYTGTATGGGIDYSAPASLLIPAGQLSKSVSITTVDDVLFEGSETILIDITTVSNGTKQGSSQTVTLTDDDTAPKVTLSLSGSPMEESGGAATLTATLSAVSAKITLVNLAFSGTATGSGVDYTASSSSIQIPAGSTTGTLTLTAVDDADGEVDETIVVDISEVSNGTENGIQQVVATITDDDKIDQTITFEAIGTKTYGEADFTLSATSTSGLALRFESSDNAIASVSGSTLSIYKAGEVTLKAIQDGNTTYAYSESSQLLNIGKKVLTVTADDKQRVYGEANPVYTYQITGFVSGETESVLTSSPVAGSVATVNSPAGNYTITAAGGSDENYDFSYVAGTLSISKATLTVTAEDKSKVYGEENPALTVGYAGFKLSDDATVLAIAPAATTVAEAASSAGNYSITAAGGSDENYDFSYVAGTLSISKATLTVTAEDKSKVYGEENPALTVGYAGFKLSDDATVLAVSPSATTVAEAASSAGNYSITAAGGSDENYDFSYVAGTLSISKATLTVTAEDKNKVYGEENPALTIAYAGFKLSDDATVLAIAPAATTVAEAASSVGSFTITAAGGSDENYDFSYVAGTLSISKATLTVTAEDKSKVYGDENPALTVAFAGFKLSDDATVLAIAPAATTVAEAASSVGSFTITAAGGSDENYDFSYVAGTLSISKATLTVTAEDKNKVYGEENPALTIAYAGFKLSDDATVLAVSPSASTTAEAASSAGNYTITAAGGSDENYEFSYVAGTLSIGKATLTVTADDQRRAFSEPESAYTIAFNGFVQGEDAVELSALPLATSMANSASAVGTYSIEVSGGDDENYAFTYVPGTLTIYNTAPVLALAIDNQTATEDQPYGFSFDAATFEEVDPEDALVYSATTTTGAALPSWLTFDAAGRSFTGLPGNQEVGITEIRLRATDKAGASATEDFSLTVLNVNDAPMLAMPLPSQAAYKNQAFLFTIPEGSFLEQDKGDFLTYTARLSNGRGMPAWLKFNAASLTFSGTPTLKEIGVVRIKVTATDTSGESISSEFELIVSDPNALPTDISLSATEVEENKAAGTLIGVLVTTDPDQDNVHTYRLIEGVGSTGNGAFYIEGDKLYSAIPFDSEVQNAYSIRIESIDGDDGKFEKVIQITVRDVEDARVFMPSLFTPNNDGQNDVFRVLANGVSEISLRIYNRMGVLVYETNDMEKATTTGWDGTYKGIAQPSGSYVWQMSGKFSDGASLEFKGKNTGNITLIR